MARQVKWVAAGIYHPAFQPRHAYGPRRWGRYELLEEFLSTPCVVLDAQTAARYGGVLGSQLSQVIAVKMPRGGVRYLLICPRCKGHVTRLYGRYHPFFRCLMHACRRCWGLRYQSQYAGRHPEAHPEYLAALGQWLAAHTMPNNGYNPYAAPRRLARQRTHRRRTFRYEHAATLRRQRLLRHEERRDLASDMAMFILVARSEAEQRRCWVKILRMVLWYPDAQTMRDLLTSADTPQWVQQALIDALERAESGEKLTKDAAKVVRTALETDIDGQFAAIIEQERMDELRARYVVLGQGQRHKRAA